MLLLWQFGLILILLAFSCKKDPVTNDHCQVSQEVRDRHAEDARRLLFREIYQDSLHPDRHTAAFNQDKLTVLLQAFQAVYSLNIPERDTVVETFGIHTYPDLGLYSIALLVDPEAPEMAEMIAGNPTQDPVFDSLLAAFALSEVSPSLFYPEFNWVTLISETPWNLFPFCEELETLDFVYIAEPGGGAAGDGNNIKLIRIGNQLELDFSIGWGDCPAGCIYRRHWIFRVDEHCNATLLEVFTD